MKISIVLNAILIAALAVMFSRQSSFNRAAIHDIKAGANVGFMVGCSFATRSNLRLRDSDPTAPIYTEWCLKNAMAFADTVELKK